MRILFILTYYTPHWTGLTQYAKLLGEGLASKGHAMTILTTRHEPSLKAHEKMRGVMVHRMAPLFQLSRTLFSVEMWLKLPLYIWQTDRVVVFLPSHDVFWVAILSVLLRKQLFLIHNGDLILPKGYMNRVIEAIFFFLTNMSMHLSQKIIVNTIDYAAQSHLLKHHKNKWVEIYPPIELIVPQKKATAMIQQKIGNHSPVVGFAGRFVHEKGFDILLKAIPFVVQQFPQVRFVYAGGKVHYETFFEQCEMLIKKAGSTLVFLGKLNREDMGSFYGFCDTLVISSRSDFFPFVQIEALLSGVPIVVTDIPGARMPVTQTHFGEIVVPESPEALAQGICKVLSHRRKYNTYVTHAKQEYDGEYSLRKHEQLFIQ